MSKIKITFDVAKPTDGTYADEKEDRLKENIGHLFNDNLRTRLLLRITKAIVAHEDIKELEKDAELAKLLMDSIAIEIGDVIKITFCAENKHERTIDYVYDLFFENMVTLFKWDKADDCYLNEDMKAAIKQWKKDDFAFSNAMFDNVVVEVA